MPKDAARRRYVEMGEIAALEQIRADAVRLDEDVMAIGPFSRLDAAAVAARDGKTRGVITNLFGSQASFQAETMALALSVGDRIAEIEYPDPADHADAEAWVDALFAGESARGPQHGAEPADSYAFLWALWLSTVPYGMWSERISRPSMDEHVLWLVRLEQVLADGIEHFGVRLRPDTTVADLAQSVASLVEGVWLNQCLTSQDPRDPAVPIVDNLRRGGLMLWRGAVLE